jgi:hypothetical protein
MRHFGRYFLAQQLICCVHGVLAGSPNLSVLLNIKYPDSERKLEVSTRYLSNQD